MTTQDTTNRSSGLAALEAASPELAGRTAARLFITPRRHPRPARERALLASALPLRHTIGEHRLAVWTWGPAAAPAVLLVHGWEGRGSQLAALVEPLLARGLRVVAFDAPAHGDSPGEQLTLVGMADIIVRMARALGPLYGVVAHSFGASAVTVALSRGLAVERVVFVAPAVSASAAVAYFARRAGLAPPSLRAYHDRIAALNDGATPAELDALRLAPAISVPLLVVHDREDPEIPIAGARALVIAWPGAELVVTDGLGHRRILRDGAVGSTAADFIGAGREADDDATWIANDLWDREGRRRRAFP